MSRFAQTLRTLWSLVWGVVWVLVLHPFWRRGAKGSNTWIIGGHRGRLYGDNSAAVEAEARRQGKNVVWIANAALAEQLRENGVRVLARQSWAARKAISEAGMLIYSHGEDDLDLLLIWLRGRSATRVYLDHCLCLLKAGGVTEPSLRRAFWPIRAFRTWLLTRWDYVLCASEEELDNFKACYPMNPFEGGAGRTDGGAHLDEWIVGLSEQVQRKIYWFPTFRDSRSGTRELEERIKEVTSSAALRAWLVEHEYEFVVGAHINEGSRTIQLNPPFLQGDLSTLAADVRTSEVLISDYSGVVFDYLILERPPILFAFDLAEYLRERHIFGNYDELDFAVHVRSTPELIAAITSTKWRDVSLIAAARRRRARSLPSPQESYAACSVLALCEIEKSEQAVGRRL